MGFRLLRVFGICWFIISISTPVKAIPVSFYFTATLAHVDPAMTTSVGLVGQTGSGRITYDTSQISWLNRFEAPPAKFIFSFAGITLVAGSAENPDDLVVDVRNDSDTFVGSPPFDGIFYWGYNISQTIDGFNVDMAILLYDFSSNLLDDGAIPTYVPNLEDFDRTGIQVRREITPGGATTTGLFFSLDSITLPVDLGGTIKTNDGTDICAMVLASGQFMFSCNPAGVFLLTDLPSEGDGTVKRQIYADGFFTKVDILSGSTDEAVVMTRSGTCPSYNTPYDPAFTPGSAGKRINISGKVLLQNSLTPICAMVLANGQHMFSCDGSGSYALNIPLDSNGQYKLQVYADGFAPTIQSFDEFKAMNDVRMARASECQ